VNDNDFFVFFLRSVKKIQNPKSLLLRWKLAHYIVTYVKNNSKESSSKQKVLI